MRPVYLYEVRGTVEGTPSYPRHTTVAATDGSDAIWFAKHSIPGLWVYEVQLILEIDHITEDALQVFASRGKDRG